MNLPWHLLVLIMALPPLAAFVCMAADVVIRHYGLDQPRALRGFERCRSALCRAVEVRPGTPVLPLRIGKDGDLVRVPYDWERDHGA